MLERITEAIKNFLIDFILQAMLGMFDGLNATLSTVSEQVGATPSGWNTTIYSAMQSISNTVVLPIAGLILTYVMTYKLIQMLIEKNSGQELGTELLFKWLLKTVIAVELVSHASQIVLGVFDVAQWAVQIATSQMSSDIMLSLNMSSWQTSLESMEIAELIALFTKICMIQLALAISDILITIIIYGRILEIYLYVAVGPIPLATFTNKDFGNIGQNYLKSILALGLQGILILVCVAIYAALVSRLGSGEITADLTEYLLYTIMLAFVLFKTGTIAKSMMNAS